MHFGRGFGPGRERESGFAAGPRGQRGENFDRGGHGFGRHGRGENFGGPDGRGHGRRRMFEGGELRLVLLLLLESEARHGYDLIRDIETRTGGAYAPSPGVVYPTLTLLEEMGHIAAQPSEGGKKQFALTEAGRQDLAENREKAEFALKKLEALRPQAEALDAAPVRRAMGNLKMALQSRIGQIKDPAADKDKLFEIAAILDEAAQKIERL